MQADVFLLLLFDLFHWRYVNLHMRFNNICENFIQCTFFIRLVHVG